MNNIKKLLNYITENYLTSLELKYNNSLNIYINSSFSELSKLLKEFGTLRFFINEKGDYAVWNANMAVHGSIFRNPEINKHFIMDDIRGQIFKDKLYVYHTGYYKIKNLEEFIENSKLFQNLKRIGIDKIEIGESL